jgi:hypothetical protein
MKTSLVISSIGALVLAVAPVGAQSGSSSGGPLNGPSFGGSLVKLFGDNSGFTAMLEIQTKGGPTDETMLVPGKLAFDQGKSRFEMDISKIQSAKMPPAVGAQMKALGMEKLITISRPDKKASYVLYPGLQSYVEVPMQGSGSEGPDEFKVETTELGKETLEGHACVRNKKIVIDKAGKQHESIVWNAIDLKDFPVKIQTEEGDVQVSMLFKDVKLSKPDSSEFDKPTDFKKYDDMVTLMHQGMMRRLDDGQKSSSGQKP